jgi:hypothetical protein
MGVLNVKAWLRTQIMLYLTIIKTWVSGLTSSLQSQIDAQQVLINSLSSVTGAYKGSFATLAAMPTGGGVKNGDWAILNADDGANESGIYVRQTGAWAFVSDLQTFQEIRTELLATAGEAAAGTSTLKVLSIAQTVDKINAAIAGINLNGKADLTGSAAQTFLVSPGNEATDQAINANQFAAITLAEAQADFDES